MTSRAFLALTFGIAAQALVACQSDPVDPTALSDQTVTRATALLKAGGANLRNNTQADSALSSIAEALAGSTFAPDVARQQLETIRAGLRQDSDGVDKAADELAGLLREAVFAQTNIESQTDDEVIYKVNATAACRRISGSTVGTKCITNLTRAELRVKMTREGDGARLAVWVGPKRIEALALIVDQDQIALESKLANLVAATLQLAKISGQDTAKLERGVAVAGTVRVTLTQEGASKATFSVSLLEALSIHLGPEAGGPFDLKSAAADPLLSMSVDGAAKTATCQVNLGTTELGAETGISRTPLHYVLAGLTGEATLDGNKNEIRLHDVGFGRGTTYGEYGGQRFFAADLNQETGGVFDAVLTSDPAKGLHIAVSPNWRLKLALQFGLLPRDLVGTVPEFSRDTTIDVKLEPDANASPVVSFLKSTIRVDRGSMLLSTTPPGAAKQAVAGQCLIGQTAGPEPTSILEAFDIVACP